MRMLCIGGPADGKIAVDCGLTLRVLIPEQRLSSLPTEAEPQIVEYRSELVQRADGERWHVYVHGPLPAADEVLRRLEAAGVPPAFRDA